MDIQDNVIEKARELFPDSISDVEAVGEYAAKIFNEIREGNCNANEIDVKSGLYQYLTRLRTFLHRKNIEAASAMITKN